MSMSTQDSLCCSVCLENQETLLTMHGHADICHLCFAQMLTHKTSGRYTGPVAQCWHMGCQKNIDFNAALEQLPKSLRDELIPRLDALKLQTKRIATVPSRKEIIEQTLDLRKSDEGYTMCPTCGQPLLRSGGCNHVTHYCTPTMETHFCHFCLTLLQKNAPILDLRGDCHFPHGLHHPCVTERQLNSYNAFPNNEGPNNAVAAVAGGRPARIPNPEIQHLRAFLRTLVILRNERLERATIKNLKSLFFSPWILLTPLAIVLALWNSIHKLALFFFFCFTTAFALSLGAVVAIFMGMLWFLFDWYFFNLVFSTALLALLAILGVVIFAPNFIVWIFLSGYRTAYDLTFLYISYQIWSQTRTNNTREATVALGFLLHYYEVSEGEGFKTLPFFELLWPLLVRNAIILSVAYYLQSFWPLILILF